MVPGDIVIRTLARGLTSLATPSGALYLPLNAMTAEQPDGRASGVESRVFSRTFFDALNKI